MSLRAEDIAKTLIDIQCDIYKRHAAKSAPVDRVEYEKWVAEATTVVTQLYGNADMGRYGMEFGRACQMATDMNAHIVAEALERSLRPDADDQERDDEDEVTMLDDLSDEIANLEAERVSISRSVAIRMQHVIDVVGDMLRGTAEMPSCDGVEAVSNDGLFVMGKTGMRVPDFTEFSGFMDGWGRLSSFFVSHRQDAGDDVVSVIWSNGRHEVIVSSCSRTLLALPDRRLREMFA